MTFIEIIIHPFVSCFIFSMFLTGEKLIMEFSYKRSYIYNTFINNWTYDTQEVILSRSNFNNLSLISNVVLSHGWKSFLIPGLKPMSAGIFRVFFLRGGESSRASKSNCVLCLPLGETFRELFSRKLALTKGLSFLLKRSEKSSGWNDETSAREMHIDADLDRKISQ